MSTVEIETGRYVKRFAFWNPATWSIPKLYWDAWSQEQRLHAICRQLEKVIAYADYVGVNVDDIAARLTAIEQGQLDEIIVQAVEDWFAEHEEDIYLKIVQLEEALPITEFDAENTVKDAFDAVNDTFDTVNSRISQAEDSISILDARTIANVHFRIASRVVVDATTLDNRGLQSGCMFQIDGKLYCAEWFATDNTDYTDILTIIDMEQNQIIGSLNMEIGHGQNPTFNPNTKQLAVCDATHIYFIDVSTPSNPNLVAARETPIIPVYGNPVYIAWDDADYQHFYVLKENDTHTDMVLLHTDTSFNVESVVELDISDTDLITWQSIDVKNGILYYCASFPEAIVMCDVETGERLNVVNVPDFIAFLPIREIEWACVIGTKLYCAQANMYPNYFVPVIFEFDLKRGTIPYEEFFPRMVTTVERNPSQYIEIGWTSADLVNPFSHTGQRPRFKFVQDAVNFCKHYGVVSPILTFTEDYPSFASITDFTFILGPANACKIGGLEFLNCDVYAYSIDRITFTGIDSDVIHTPTYLHGIRCEASRFVTTSGTIWSVEDETGSSLTPSTGNFISSLVISTSIEDWGVSVWAGCVAGVRASSHANAISQAQTMWLNG